MDADATTLADRAERIGLSFKAIAEAANVNPNTVSRTLTGKTDPRNLTGKSINEAILRRELALRDYLIDLYGLPDRDVFVVAGKPRRVVKPALEQRTGEAA